MLIDKVMIKKFYNLLFIILIFFSLNISAMKRKTEEETDFNRNVRGKIETDINQPMADIDQNNIINTLIDVGSQANINSYGEPEARITSLMESVLNNDVNAVEKELSAPDININFADKHGKTALYYAAANVDEKSAEKNLQIIKLLLGTKGIEIDKPDIDGITALAIAIISDNQNAVKALLDECQKNCPNLEARDKKIGYTPLMRAAQTGNDKIISMLLKHGANISATVKIKDADSNKFEDLNALIIAQKRKQPQAIAILKPYEERALKFMKAVLSYPQNKEEAIKLLSLGLDPSTRDSNRNTPLIAAAQKKFSEVIDDLIKLGADVNANNSGLWTPLQWASLNGDDKTAQKLIDAGANIQDSYLVSAVKALNKPLIELLIKAGAKINPVDQLLAKPVENNRADIVKLLLLAGANPNVADEYGTRPLYIAIRRGGSSEIIKLLEDAGAVAIRGEF